MGFNINDASAVLEVDYFDSVTDDLIVECQLALFAREGFDTKDLLVDYTAVNAYQVTMPGLKKLTDIINQRFEKTPPLPAKRFAYVVPEDVEYGMGRVFLAFVEENDNSRLFRSRGEALAWLGIHDADELPSAC